MSGLDAMEEKSRPELLEKLSSCSAVTVRTLYQHQRFPILLLLKRSMWTSVLNGRRNRCDEPEPRVSNGLYRDADP